jgi:hypothetical protein
MTLVGGDPWVPMSLKQAGKARLASLPPLVLWIHIMVGMFIKFAITTYDAH